METDATSVMQRRNKYQQVTAAWLAQLVRRQSAVREVSGSIPGRTTTPGLKGESAAFALTSANG